jgi:hypothetical protein
MGASSKYARVCETCWCDEAIGTPELAPKGQDAQLQFDALVTAGVQKGDGFADVTPPDNRIAIVRPRMTKALDYAEAGDTVIVWRFDRLGRSIDVLNNVELSTSASSSSKVSTPRKQLRS